MNMYVTQSFIIMKITSLMKYHYNYVVGSRGHQDKKWLNFHILLLEIYYLPHWL